MSDFYHVCFAVQDIEQATSELSAALGVSWNPIREGSLGDWNYRIVFSVAGPPFFELIEGSPGSPWDSTGGSHFHHLGYWSRDIATDKQLLSDRGAPLDFDSCPYGRSFSYHNLPSIGSRVELVDVSAQDGFRQTWSPNGPVMPPLDF